MTCWIGTSWKMNKTVAEALAYADGLVAAGPAAHPDIQRFVVPPFTAVREVRQRLDGTSVLVGAQNMHWEDSGPWTGEVSAPMLADCGLHLVELGHSERRAHFGETDEAVGRKAAAAVRHGLIPLICIGETAAERDAGRARAVLAAQVETALAGVGGAPVLLAYEPVWAIGDGGRPATADYADARHEEIKATARGVLGRSVPCLYGGSVNAENCQALVACAHVDGLFIGRAAWDVDGYLDILARAAQVIGTGRKDGLS